MVWRVVLEGENGCEKMNSEVWRIRLSFYENFSLIASKIPDPAQLSAERHSKFCRESSRIQCFGLF